MKKGEGKEVVPKRIRSELTHEQEVLLVHSGPSKEIIERIQENLKYLQERSKASQKDK